MIAGVVLVAAVLASNTVLEPLLAGLGERIKRWSHYEDVISQKGEYYFYLDSTPTHSYMQMLYKYPQAEFPYSDLIQENRRRGYQDFEYELLDTGVFAGDRYFDVVVEYAKAAENDILIRISLTNRGPEAAGCYVLPTLWYRNTWSWGYEAGPMGDVSVKPLMKQIAGLEGVLALQADHPAQGTYYLYAEDASDLLFTENETNTGRLYGVQSSSPYVKDGFHRYLIHSETGAVNPIKEGTKAAALYHNRIAFSTKWRASYRINGSFLHTPKRACPVRW